MNALETVKLAIVLIAGLTLGWVAATFYAGVVTVPAARTEGAQIERLVWEKAQRAAEAQADADRRVAQSRIDEIERSFHQRESDRLAQLSALEAAIEQETSRDPIPPAAGSGGACPAAVPRRLRDALASVGAASLGDDPAGSHGGLP